MSKTETPRTDALAKGERHKSVAETHYWCDQFRTLARQLERELDTAREQGRAEGFSAAREAAAKVCDEVIPTEMLGKIAAQICKGAAASIAHRIRALKDGGKG